jgi:hypothetical protein
VQLVAIATLLRYISQVGRVVELAVLVSRAFGEIEQVAWNASDV